MASGTGRRMSTLAKLATSDVHADHPCTECFLCKECPVAYTHPAKWKHETLFAFAKHICPDITPLSCICRNCRDNLASGQKDPTNYHPRWTRHATTKLCEVPQCGEAASRCTKLGDRALFTTLFNCPVTSDQTNLCSTHYRVLHREVNPDSYKWNCTVCSAPLRASTYRTCKESETFQRHLQEHTDFSGSISTSDKLCMACYRYSLAIVRQMKEKPATTDSDLKRLIAELHTTLPMLPSNIDEQSKLIDTALTLTAINVANYLEENRAITLLSAHSKFLSTIETLLPMCTFQPTPQKQTPRWLLGQLSTQLKHHMSYTCIVKKHGVIIYRQGRELHALSHAMHSAKGSSKSDSLQEVLRNVNSKIHQLMQTTLETTFTPATLDLDNMIKSIDPDIWNTMCTLTSGTIQSDSLAKKTRRLFILHQIMFCIDNRCSMPFHVLNADIIDCFGGSAELLRILNRLGVCVSQDTLLRHIHSAVAEQEKRGLLQGLNPDGITMFTMDNVDFLHSHAQVYSGNQKSLTWHGTTVQAIQTKPSLNPSLYSMENRKRVHALLSPMSSPNTGGSIPKQIRSRARTGTELQSNDLTPSSSSYNFHSQSLPSSDEPVKTMAMSDFRLSDSEEISVDLFKTQAFTYCMIKNALPAEKQKEFLGFQEFYGISTNASTPEVGYVKYIEVLDELADSKDTVLHVISDLYNEYMVKHKHKFLVLEGDAKVYDVIQGLKYEYASDLDWLIPFPGDWHLLKNYQICLMKPFYEAGLKDLAIASGYPATSIENCSKFRRTHLFLMESWECLFRVMLDSFLSSHSCDLIIDHTVGELHKYQHDKVAAYSVIRSFQEEMTTKNAELEFYKFANSKSAVDDTWQFWYRFVLEDCLPYVGLFMAIRSEDWKLRIASLKSMAADFTAFDHQNYQKLISQHITDLFSFPKPLLEYMEKGGFALSISGRTSHSVALDESHEMLINRHVKGAVMRPTKEYLGRIAKYIPIRVKCLEQLKSQIFDSPCDQHTAKSVVFGKDPADAKSETNIQCQMKMVTDHKLLPHDITSNRGLINPFRKLTANEAQKEDLLTFHKTGSDLFENRIEAYVLKNPSVKVPMKRRRLQTFSTQKNNKRKVTSLQQEMKKVQKCMRRKIAYASKTGTNPDVMGEQYIELPRALCDIDNLPTKGQKSLVTGFYQTRYKENNLISHVFPANWNPDSVILDGMFLIQTLPLGSHKVMADYSNFLIKRFVTPHFTKGSKEVHLLFDDPDQQHENPKVFEQARRDREKIKTNHTCMVFFEDAEVPTNWNNTINCRKCKRELTIFLSSHITTNVYRSLQGLQQFVTSGATCQAGALVVSRSVQPSTINPSAETNIQMYSIEQSPLFEYNVCEADTRIWLHSQHSVGPKKFILSPDTDVYHIGLPLISQNEEVIVQISKPSDKELKLLDLTCLVDLLKRDPDLSHISGSSIPQTIQTLFASTGCDYVSFFSGIGKAYFFKVFLESSKFILSCHPDAFCISYTCSSLQQQAQNPLAFIRLVGCAYLKKHSNAFYGQTPQSIYNSFAGASTPVEQHIQWLDFIRQGIWERITLESEMVPSYSSLELHWRRSCWVVHMWQQALSNLMTLATLEGNGWAWGDDGRLDIVWETEEKRKEVKDRVLMLLKGCGCKSGCKSKRCGCKRRGVGCGPGCRCTDCRNVTSEGAPTERTQIDDQTDTLDYDTMDLGTLDEDVDDTMDLGTLDEDVDYVMNVVFGELEEHEDYSSDSDSFSDTCLVNNLA